MLIMKIILLSASIFLFSGCATKKEKIHEKTKTIYMLEEGGILNSFAPIIIKDNYFVFEGVVSNSEVIEIYQKYEELRIKRAITNLVTAKKDNYFTARSPWFRLQGKKTGVSLFEKQWEGRAKFAFHVEKDVSEKQVKCFVLYLNQERLNEKNEWNDTDRIDQDMLDFLNPLKDAMLGVCK